ncbi:unnamed protein product [Closterium sp. NIES-65]|nr:unnamed protein product [Closterium sp. NIES-65]CAI5950561.1 unnamed protein product [Closterium sp. NIES-65]
MRRCTVSCTPLALAVLLSLSLCCAAGGAVRRELLDASDGLLTQTVTTTTGSSGSSSSGGSTDPNETLVIKDSLNCACVLVCLAADRASSVLTSQTSMGANFNIDVNITSTQQRALFTFTVTAVPISPAPVFSNSSYHTNAGQLVATFACVPKPTIMLGIYQCTASSLANITVPFRPVNRPKALVDAGLFSNPSGFYSTISVNGVSLRGGITTSVANL